MNPSAHAGRRHFLRQLVAAGAAAALPASAWATAGSPEGPRVLLVFLRGGYDCANALVPYASSFYYESRPTIAIPRPVAGTAPPAGGALALDGDWALAPALVPSLGARWQARELAFVPFAGSDDLSRSHFETQDAIELGQPAGGPRDYGSGFLARLAGVLKDGGRDPAPIAFTDALPLSFRGQADVPNVSLRNVGKAAFDARQSALLEDLWAAHRLQPAVADGLELRSEIATEFADEMRQADRGAVSPRGFEAEARRIGRVMREHYRLAFVDVGGWDTHVNEGAATGALAGNLGTLARGLDAFAAELGPAWRETVVVVVSEFGRTFRENGGRGTDHGHGSVYWLLGGAVRGGRIAGRQVAVTRANLFQDRDYPVLTDGRALLGGVFARLFGLSRERVETVFPGVAPVDLGLV
jgi:uncharacterized protein (DUF1501 family)